MVLTKRISYLCTDFAPTTPMKTIGLRGFAALTSTSAAKNLLPVRGSRKAVSMDENHFMHTCTTERAHSLSLALPSLSPEHVEEACGKSPPHVCGSSYFKPIGKAN